MMVIIALLKDSGVFAWIVSLILLEGLFTGLAGAAAALILGSPVLYYLSTKGIDFGALVGGDLGVGNVLFDPYLYGDFGIWMVWYAFSVSVAATVIAAIYPAWFAVKTDPAAAIRTV
jgi:ABC-type lipoprotein release transport system permease subunit